MFLSLRYLPLADAVAIAFVMPFITLFLGRFVLGEDVGSRRMIACCVGFVGTLMVMQPSFAEVGWPALLPVAVAIDFAFFVLATRHLAKEVDAVSLQAVSGVIACALLVPLLAVLAPYDVPGFVLAMPDQDSMWLLAAMGLLGTCAHLMMTWSLRFAPSATVAPMQYLEIPIAALLGWLIFKDFPNGLALAGIFVTIASGLYVIYREHALNRSAQRLPGRGGSLGINVRHPGQSNSSSTRPDARFDVPRRPRGSSFNPSMGQRSPVEVPFTGVIGKSEKRVPSGRLRTS